MESKKMRMKVSKILVGLLCSMLLSTAVAQVVSGGAVQKRTSFSGNKQSAKINSKSSTGNQGGVSERMKSFYESAETNDAELEFQKEVYREIDLKKGTNGVLYYPEDVVDGKRNLFRIVFDAVTKDGLPAYEYLDGREIFTNQYQLSIEDMLNRFGIYYKKGTTKGDVAGISVEESDVPSSQVNSYYVIEKWEFDRRQSKMKHRVVAICPILTRIGEFGGETKFPMFWVKFDKLRPYLASQYVFQDDDNNLESQSLDDWFTAGKYKGDIYKIKNMRNLTMAQMYPDEDLRIRAQDSIDKRLREYGKNIWVPTREEYNREQERKAVARKAIVNGDSIPGRTVVYKEEKTVKDNSRKRKSVASKTKSNASSEVKTAVRSVRRTRR